MLTTGNLRDPDFGALLREAMETDNHLALDLMYTIRVFPESWSEWWAAHNWPAPTAFDFPLRDPE